MTRLKRLMFVFCVGVAAWVSQQPTDALHTAWTHQSETCVGGRYVFTNHPHNCSYGSGYLASCASVCGEMLVVSASCTINGSGQASGECLCGPLFCCEANGCPKDRTDAAGWSTGACGGDHTEGPDQCGCCRASSSPIIVPVEGDRITLSSAAAGVLFDFWGDGSPLRYAWPRSPDSAWLVIDRNHNGKVDDAGELFGNAARLTSGQFAANGYELLDEFDTNRDGVVDASDPRFGEILLWRDVKRNGIVDPGRRELLPAWQAGIIAFHTRYTESRRVDEWGNAFRYKARVTFSQAPKERFSYDVFLTSTAAPIATSLH
jgi:hypothetical protein